MPASSVQYLIPFLASAMLSFGIGFYALNFVRIPGAIPFSLLSFFQSLWTVSIILGLISPTIQGKQFWNDWQWLLSFPFTLSLYWFCQAIVPSKRLFKIPKWLLFVFPILFTLALAANPQLIYIDTVIIKGVPFDSLEHTFSLIDWLVLVYEYALILFCLVSLALECRQTVGQAHRQLGWALIGISIPFVLYIVMFALRLSILGQHDATPFTFLIGNLFLGWGFFRYGFFDLSPMARSQVVENMPDAFILTDPQGKIVDMNRVARTYAPPEAHNQNIAEVFKGWAASIQPERYSTSFTHDFVRDMDDTLKSLEMRVSPLTNAQKEVRGYLVVVRDISSRKMLENALAASEERYRSIIESMAEGVILHDQSGAILTCNQAAETILGLRYDQIEGRNVQDVVHYAMQEDGSPFTTENLPVSMTLRTGQVLRDAVMGVKHSDGTVRWLLINSQPFDFTDQDMTETKQVVISFRDVTDMRRMQAEATRAEIDQDRTRLLAQFIQSASHEFRTPLAIIGTSVYLVNRQPDPDRRDYHAEVAQREIRRIERLLETLVNMVQLDSGLPLNRVPTRIEPLVHSVVLRFAKAAHDHRICLQFNAPSSLPFVCVDPDYLSMGIQQVLDNAIRYTPDGGSVNVDVIAEEDTFVITINDNGLGIDENEFEHIFDRFWRHDTAHSTPGFGLGLSIAQKVVERHEGTIEVNSCIGCGTKVRLRLPLAQPSTVGAKSVSPV